MVGSGNKGELEPPQKIYKFFYNKIKSGFEHKIFIFKTTNLKNLESSSKKIDEDICRKLFLH